MHVFHADSKIWQWKICSFNFQKLLKSWKGNITLATKKQNKTHNKKYIYTCSNGQTDFLNRVGKNFSKNLMILFKILLRLKCFSQIAKSGWVRPTELIFLLLMHVLPIFSSVQLFVSTDHQKLFVLGFDVYPTIEWNYLVILFCVGTKTNG